MTPEELDAIEARLGAITPGQWQLIRYDHGSGRIYVAGEHDGGAEGERRALVLDTDTREPNGVATAYHEGDREFFFHAPSDVARLVAEVRRLRGGEPAQPATPDRWTTGWENPQGLVWWFLRGSDGVRRARSFPCSDGTFGWDIPVVIGETYPTDATGAPIWPGENGYATLQDAQRAAEEWVAKNGGTP